VREGTDIAILSYGTRLHECLAAAETLAGKNISVTVADARFAKPLDTQLVNDLVKNHRALITIEEGSALGFGAIVLQHLANAGKLDGKCQIRTLHLPDIFQDQDKPEKQYDEAGLNAAQIVQSILSLK
jgi:1-deoxy-D-xylulose-5-phosphate synthase